MTRPVRRSEQLAQHRDPSVTAPGNPSATPLVPPHGSAQFERGVILEVDARRHSYRVVLNSGRTFTMARLRSSPGDTALLDRGTNVLVMLGVGEPYIFGILPLGTAHTDVGPTLSEVDGHGGADPVLDRSLTVNARDPATPTDLLPGDEGLQGPDGASVSALRGQIAQLFGGPLAKVQAFGESDRVTIVAGELRVATWVGESTYTNDGGRTNFRWQGGSEQTTQTGADEERYTVFLDVGSEGDVVRFRITNRERQDLFRVHVDANGRAELFAAGGLVRGGGSGSASLEETVHHGSSQQEITGDCDTRIGGTRKDNTGGAWQAVVAGLFELVAGTDVSILGANSVLLRSGGEVLISGTDATQIAGDGVTINPRTGKMSVQTNAPDAIELGAGATSHGVKYEELRTLLETLLSRLNELAASVARHVHPSDGVVSGTLAAFNAPLRLDFAPAKAPGVLLK